MKLKHEKMVRLNFTISRALAAVLTKLSEGHTRNKSEIMREALIEWCKKRGVKIEK